MKTQYIKTATRLCILALVLSASAAYAHGGDAHDAPAQPAGENAPQRLPDGSVFLPKPAQRQMDLRTQTVALTTAQQAVVLNGRVVMDPNAGGKVQAMVAGRVSPTAQGLPVVGQVVRRGEVLAQVVPARAAQDGRSLAEIRVQRMRQLTDIVPRKALEEAEAALANEQMLAPVSGVIAATYVVAGQVVEARETLFEIIDPRRLQIEALAYDVALPAGIRSASAVVGGKSVPLRFVGAARALRDQALPVMFRAEGEGATALAVGQPLTVVVQTGDQVGGVPVPAQAVMKNAANQSVVWVKTGAEQFVPNVVSLQPLDGARVLVTAGLKGGERVVTQAAALLNQVR